MRLRLTLCYETKCNPLIFNLVLRSNKVTWSKLNLYHPLLSVLLCVGVRGIQTPLHNPLFLMTHPFFSFGNTTLKLSFFIPPPSVDKQLLLFMIMASFAVIVVVGNYFRSFLKYDSNIDFKNYYLGNLSFKKARMDNCAPSLTSGNFVFSFFPL